MVLSRHTFVNCIYIDKCLVDQGLNKIVPLGEQFAKKTTKMLVRGASTVVTTRVPSPTRCHGD